MDASIHDVVPRPTRRPHVRTVIRVAQHTGTRPFLCYASDENQYWCKIFNGPHGWEGTLNEIVASVIGEQIQAPIRPWKILDIPESLVSTQVGEGTQRYRLPAAPRFRFPRLAHCRRHRSVKRHQP